jgi:hypothetical protein
MHTEIHHRAASRKSVDVDKIAKLLRLLASDKDGEVLATVAALGRTLLASELCFHDLADAAEAGFAKPSPTKNRMSKWSPPAPDLEFWQSMATWCHHHRQHLTAVDRAYVAEVLLGEHFDNGAADETMMNRLRNIVDKIETARDADWWA